MASREESRGILPRFRVYRVCKVYRVYRAYRVFGVFGVCRAYGVYGVFRKNPGVRIRGTLGDTLNKSLSKRAQAT